MAKINPRAQRLNGLFPLAYMGVVPVSPGNFVIENRPPTQDDSKNFYIGDIWLDYNTDTPPQAKDVWMLVALVGNLATWVHFGGGNGTVQFLQGNTGGPVGPDINAIIHTIGNTANGITVSGNPATFTLTVDTTGGGPIGQSITGNSGGAVQPDVTGNWNLLGTGVITVVGNPATHTLTITPSGSIASSFPTDSGTATPAAGVLNILAQNATLGCGSSVLFSAPGPSNTVQLNVTDASNNTIIGKNAGNLTLTSTNTTALGQNAGHALTSGANSVLIGNACGSALTTASNSIFIGNSAGSATTTGSSNILIGPSSGSGLGGSDNLNIFIGNQAGQSTEAATIRIGNGGGGGVSNNIFIGTNAGNNTYTVASAVSNFAIGLNSLSSLTTGAGNFAIGINTFTNLTTGSFNIGILGGLALTTGSSNTYCGYLAGNSTSTGSNNLLLGQSAGSHLNGADSGNVFLADSGTAGDSRTIRISSGDSTSPALKCFIGGIRGVTTGNADAIAVLIDSATQLGTVSSSINFKENIMNMDEYSEDIYDLRPVTFNYIEDKNHYLRVGLIAEEVAEVLPSLVAHDKDGAIYSVKYHDLPVLLLNELQKLYKRIMLLESELEEFKK